MHTLDFPPLLSPSPSSPNQTLVNTVIRKYASDHLKQKYLPQLSESSVSVPSFAAFKILASDLTCQSCPPLPTLSSSDPSVFPSQPQDQTPSP